MNQATTSQPERKIQVEQGPLAWSGTRSRSLGVPLYQWCALNNPYSHFAFYGGVGAGKTFVGAQYAIKRMRQHPHLTGLIGANNYDQMNQATLRELLHWLGVEGYDFVIHKTPPKSWGARENLFPRYTNILSVKIAPGHVAHAFTRVMSDSDPLRGIQISWYWLDEVRDTPEDTHDVVLSRCREGGEPNAHLVGGIVTTTTNGEDWSYRRFVREGNRAGDKMYGSMHVKTLQSVEAGILSRAYYSTLLRTYSPLMAQQELDAEHVNVGGGRAYHSWAEYNKSRTAPWGDSTPSRARPLLVGMDFNFSPAPLVWMIAQLGPFGTKWAKHLHVFNELQGVQMSTRAMSKRLAANFPGYKMRCFGDASGGKGSTSNAGEHDYAQVMDELQKAGIVATVDYDQANPLVKDRVENMNAHARNLAQETHVTYNPDACPLLDEDVRQVGWNKAGKLDDGGVVTRTHASDGLGYLLWKILPYGRRGGAPLRIANLASETAASY